MGVLDYAGRLVVEIVSGSSVLALALVLGADLHSSLDSSATVDDYSSYDDFIT